MPLDGLFLKKLSNELNFLVSGKINKVLEVSDTDFIFQVRVNRVNYNLLVSLSSEYARIHLTQKTYEYPQNPKGFTMLLRKHFEGSIITNIYTNQLDRVFVIECEGLNEIGDLSKTNLVFELMGRYSNMIIVKNNTIIDALKKINALEGTRTVFPNATFNFIETNKINPYNLSINEIDSIFKINIILTSKDITSNFQGMSPLASEYIINSNNPSETMYNLINSDISASTIQNKNKMDFYFNSLDKEIIKSYDSLSLLLDDYYYQKSKNERIRQKTNDISLFISRQIKRLEDKITKLEIDLNDALKLDTYKLYGELLIANSYIKEKSKEITVLNYYNNENITISLDQRYSIIDNSKIYFKKYQKCKNAIAHINEQKLKTLDEIEYFKLIKAQIENANMNDILEIQQELSGLKYLDSTTKSNKKKTKSKILCYTLINGTNVLVGKNNVQNEIITHKLAKANEMWFHIKDGPGSHVLVLKDTELDEIDIRGAAMIAAYYSTYKDSSSVPVQYTKARYIKKIPGKRNCFVTFTNEKTIYIDPDKDFIDSLESSIRMC